MAECHPVGFQWVMEAKRRGAEIIHVDPRFTRTSAVVDLHVPIRAGSDIAFLGGLIHHVLSEGKEFREYVAAYTNAATIVSEDFRDTEDLDGLFSGGTTRSGSTTPPPGVMRASASAPPPVSGRRTPAARTARPRPRGARRPSKRTSSAAADHRSGPGRRSTPTRRSPTRAACSSSSSATTSGTPRRWWPRSAAF